MMTDTIELPVADAMTASDLVQHARQIAVLIGTKNAECFVSASGHKDNEARVSCYTNWLTTGADSGHESFSGRTWAEALAQAYAWARTIKIVARDKRIRELALAIVDLTDQHGSCRVEHLRARRFSDAEIAELRDAALTRANEMAGGAPFEIVGVV
jgi:hypothetical protein